MVITCSVRHEGLEPTKHHMRIIVLLVSLLRRTKIVKTMLNIIFEENYTLKHSYWGNPPIEDTQGAGAPGPLPGEQGVFSL